MCAAAPMLISISYFRSLPSMGAYIYIYILYEHVRQLKLKTTSTSTNTMIETKQTKTKIYAHKLVKQDLMEKCVYWRLHCFFFSSLSSFHEFIIYWNNKHYNI